MSNDCEGCNLCPTRTITIETRRVDHVTKITGDALNKESILVYTTMSEDGYKDYAESAKTGDLVNALAIELEKTGASMKSISSFVKEDILDWVMTCIKTLRKERERGCTIPRPEPKTVKHCLRLVKGEKEGGP
jgi:hypothetical protein